MAAKTCPKCSNESLFVESIDHGIDYVVSSGYYVACEECEYESDVFVSYDDAAKLLEGVLIQPTTGVAQNF